MDIDGSNKRTININLDRNIESLKWSADGKNLYFMYDNYGNTKIATTNLTGRVRKLIDDVGGTSIGRPYGGGSYSVSSEVEIS